MGPEAWKMRASDQRHFYETSNPSHVAFSLETNNHLGPIARASNEKIRRLFAARKIIASPSWFVRSP